MRPICPPGRKMDYASSKDGQQEHRPVTLQESWVFLERSSPKISTMKNIFLNCFNSFFFLLQKQKKLWSITVGFPNPWFIVTLTTVPLWFWDCCTDLWTYHPLSGAPWCTLERNERQRGKWDFLKCLGNSWQISNLSRNVFLVSLHWELALT